MRGQDGCSNQTLTPTTSCTVVVRYEPEYEEIHNDSFDIPSTDPDAPTVTVSVSGMGAPMRMAKLVVSSTKLPFGSVTVGTSADQTLTLTNTGDADLSVFELGSANPLAAPFALAAGQDGCSNQTLSPESSCTVVVRYSPTDEETRNDSFDIPSTDPDEPKMTVSVSGSGLSSTANNPPISPALVFPADGMEGLPTTVTFSWDESSDPDGETVIYDLYYCENSSFEGCAPLEVAAFLARTRLMFMPGLVALGS